MLALLLSLSVCPSPPLPSAGGTQQAPVVINNLGLACEGTIHQAGPFVAFFVDEEAQAGVDRNGDGDTGDKVLHVLDRRTRTVVNTGLGTFSTRLCVSETTFALLVFEGAAGGKDLNGDGDAQDSIPFLYDAERNRITNTGLAQSNRSLLAQGGTLFLSVRESAQGNIDRNADGDSDDDVVAWVDLASGRITNSGLASSRDVSPFQDWVAIRVGESKQGQTDLNGDGASDDEVEHVLHLGTAEAVNLGMDSAGELAIGAGRLIVSASEFGDGVDYNNDGQIGFDSIMHLYDARRGTKINLGRAGAFYAASPEIEGLVFFGDAIGAALPYPVYALDAASGEITSLGITTRQALVAWQSFVVAPSQQSEPAQVFDVLGGSSRDLSTFFYFVNFDGGLVTGYQGNPSGPFRSYDPLLGKERSLGPTTSTGVYTTDRDGAVVSWIQSENLVGTDFNRDGDTTDSVLRVYDPAEDRVHAIDRAVRGFNPREHEVANGALAFLVSEPNDGVTDWNGDGDTNDFVLHVAELNFPSAETDRYGIAVRGWRGRAPLLEVLGEASQGRALAIQVRRARPQSAGVLVVGTAPDAVPIFGGTLLVQAPFLSLSAFSTEALGFDGLARLVFDAIPPGLAGSLLYLQGGVVDPEAIGGVALTRGLRLRVGG